MFVACDLCGYNSGDRESAEALVDKVTADGGKMIPSEGGYWIIACPKGHDGDEVHLD